ncbi:MAG: hypothetical protein KKA31_01230, partial [Candidatus Margulisbacteria bacterium]|nr:hypothetical protein [Candidatus Margulisiibacteriota bacterium]
MHKVKKILGEIFYGFKEERQRKIKIFFAFFIFAGFLFLFASLAYSAIPQQINYQGKLTDENNVPIADGAYSIAFRIYDDETAGSAIWYGIQTVTTESGFFNVVLGTSASIPTSVFTGEARWLSINVDSDGWMTPRQKLVSVGYAFYAYDSENLGGQPPSYYAPAADSGSYVELAPSSVQVTNEQYAVRVGVGHTSGRAVYAESTAETGTTYGGYFKADSSSGRAVYGEATSGSGENYGGYFVSNSSDGYGIYAAGKYGVKGVSDLNSGRGVWGLATGETSYGLYGQGKACGTYGQATAATGETYGVYGITSSPDGYAGMFAGNVKITGTIEGASPVKVSGGLSVVGTLETTSGGVKFPDGTIQTTAIITGEYVTSVSSQGASGLTGDVDLKAGTNVSVTQTGQTIEVATSGNLDADTLDSLDSTAFVLVAGDTMTGTLEISSGNNLIVDTDTLYVDGANNYVGIGKTNPDNPLDVYLNQTATYAAHVFNDQSNQGHGLFVQSDGIATGSFILTVQSGSYNPVFRVSGSNVFAENLSIGTDYLSTVPTSDGLIVEGDVGIGIITPEATLHVAGDIKATGYVSSESSFYGDGSNLTGLVTSVSSQGASDLTGDVDIKAGTNIAVTQTGQTIEVATSGNLDAATLDGLDSTQFVKLGPPGIQSTSAAYAIWVSGEVGISAEGATRGGYFKDSDSSGYASIGYGNYGMSASGNTAGIWGQSNG